MYANLTEWLNLLLRWTHILAGIGWIGSSFFFMWLDSAIAAPESPRPGVKGELWMVHSGGFYQVEKRIIGPGSMPKVLHWFKWEAFLTWLSGFSLLCVVYYLSNGIYLVDPSVSAITPGMATLLGLGLLPVAWLVYDLIWASPLATQAAPACTVLSLSLLCGVIWELTHVLSGRGAFIHVGAMLGTLMMLNVWMRILPAQRQMIAATERGEQPDLTLGARAKKRSVHNNYMTFPVVFIMISNHFPSTYGHKQPGLVLLLIMLAGAGVRHVMNVGKRVAWLLVPVAATIATLIYMTAPHPREASAAAAKTKGASASTAPARAIDPATVGTIEGVVKLDGKPPARVEIPLPPGCSDARPGPVYDEKVVSSDGHLANTFVWISGGLDGVQLPTAPTLPATINQRGCTYEPRVVGVRVGQPLQFLNGDALLHNIHAVAEENGEFNEAMMGKDTKVTKTFDSPEIMVHMKCDVHPWMGAWIGVVPHPWFAVSAPDGTFRLTGVPPGDYTVEAWHEVYGKQQAKVTVTAKGTATAGFTFVAK